MNLLRSEFLKWVMVVGVGLAMVAAFAMTFGCSTVQVPVQPQDEVTVEKLLDRSVQIEANCPEGAWRGSGVIVYGTSNGMAIGTAEHVAPSSDCQYSVVRVSGERHIVWRSARDERHDTAALWTLDGDFYPVIPMRHAALGEEVIAVGWPSDLLKGKTHLTVTRGNIAAIYGFREKYAYRSTAPIRPGNSGGPLFGLDGSVVGLNVAGWVQSGIFLADHGYVTSIEHLFWLLDL